MSKPLLKLLYIWVEIVMYCIASRPDCSQEDRDKLGFATKELQDEISASIEAA